MFDRPSSPHIIYRRSAAKRGKEDEVRKGRENRGNKSNLYLGSPDWVTPMNSDALRKTLSMNYLCRTAVNSSISPKRGREWVRAKTIQATASPELPAIFTGKKNAIVMYDVGCRFFHLPGAFVDESLEQVSQIRTWGLETQQDLSAGDDDAAGLISSKECFDDYSANPTGTLEAVS